MKRRLDRMVGTMDWIKEFQNSKLISLLRIALNHYPIKLKMDTRKKKKSPLKFKFMWMSHPNFKDNMKEWWKYKTQGKTM